MTADGDDPTGDDPRTVVRDFWRVEIQGLRDRFDRERLENNLAPISNKEIARETNIPQSTLSDLLTCKRDVVPDWDDRVGPIVGFLGGTSKEWVPKWRAARAAYDSLGKPPPPAAPEQPRSRKRRWGLVIAAAAIAVVGGGVWIFVASASDEPASGPGILPATGYTGSRCERVKDDTESVSVFKDPQSHEKWTEWPGRTRFRAEVDVGNPNRYRVLLTNGQYGYVNRDPRYIASAKDCP
ncbi:hypothetical protein [Actinocrispum sp. NPDC049592]|uniref:hypothetical protein n=1 Tax=Actinocrispum sp. NPDC049592 TaxID=3154835 RepID=UPI0034424676